jgi:Flp pilus assembly protein TadD
LGDAARQSGDLAEAVTWYGRALSFRGNIIEVLNALGSCYLDLGDKARALEVFRKSLELGPGQESIRKIVSEIKSE